MARFPNVSAIAPDLGRIFLFMGMVSLLPLLIGLFYREFALILPMASAPLAFITVASFLLRVPRIEREPPLSIALASVAMVWIVASFAGALPFTLGIGMPYTDAVFEAMSGWTSTGLSLIADVDAVPRTLLFWRSLSQWMGGIGIVAFSMALASRSSMTSFRLYRSEGRSETLMPGVVATAHQMWRIYVVLTLAGVGLVLLSGIPLWDAINISMTAIATGGFSVHTGGIMYYRNPLLEMLIVPIMIAGALPFKIYYLMYYRKETRFYTDPQARLLFLLITAGVVLVTLDLVFLTQVPLLVAVRESLFMVTSAITCTGFNNANPFAWSSVTVLFLSLLMLIGGSSGSTAGGIKLSRVNLGIETLGWWFNRLYTGSRVLIPFRHEGKGVRIAVAEYEVSKNMLVIMLFVLTVFAGSILLLHLDPGAGFDSGDVIFDVVSAISNVGLSTGYVNPEMSVAGKWLFVLIMWAGRLEILPVIALALSLSGRFSQKRG
ncbi:MAG: TrkH family potassium uptake protein [Methanomicrobiaceae archaeon]|nr:TrkH family potassium uptake protein [Methanomicrobiaceae archaeon]